jgi:hypothetical protein
MAPRSLCRNSTMARAACLQMSPLRRGTAKQSIWITYSHQRNWLQATSVGVGVSMFHLIIHGAIFVWRAVALSSFLTDRTGAIASLRNMSETLLPTIDTWEDG